MANQLICLKVKPADRRGSLHFGKGVLYHLQFFTDHKRSYRCLSLNLFTIGLMATQSLFILATARSVRIMECFLVKEFFQAIMNDIINYIVNDNIVNDKQLCS